MVSTVNSRGIPGRETAGGYDIHHGHSRQATLHTAFLNSARGINSSTGSSPMVIIPADYWLILFCFKSY